MAAIFRLGGCQIFNQLRNGNLGIVSLIRPVTLKAQPAPKEEDLGHDERNMKLGRPQSPHLSIYRFQLTSGLSITHRATGMILAGYTILFGTSAIILPDTIPNYLDALENEYCEGNVGDALISTVKFMLAMPMCYHFWNGVRHLAWDFGACLSLSEVYITGYAMLVLAIGSAIALTMM